MENSTKIIHERTKHITIQKKSPTYMKDEYGLKQYPFDPSQSSPPNNFMIKLQLRMNYYDSFINSDKRTKE